MYLRGNSIGTDDDDDDGRRRRHTLNLFNIDKPIGASPRLDEDGTILVCSTYSTYTVRIGTSKKGGNAPRATDKKSMCGGILILRKPW